MTMARCNKFFYKTSTRWTSYDTDGNKTAIAVYDKGQKTGKWFGIMLI
jgi:hypothetical protein